MRPILTSIIFSAFLVVFGSGFSPLALCASTHPRTAKPSRKATIVISSKRKSTPLTHFMEKSLPVHCHRMTTVKGEGDGVPPDTTKRLWPKAAIALTTILALTRSRISPRILLGVGTTAVLALGALRLRRKQAARKRNDRSSESFDSKKEVESIWVSNRLREADARKEEEEEAKRAKERAREAQQMKQAKKWAASTLQNTEQLRSEAEERRAREAEERRRAKMWVENAARGSNIDLGIEDSGGDDGDFDELDE